MIPCPDCGGSLELELEDFDSGNDELLTCQNETCRQCWTHGQLAFIERYGPLVPANVDANVPEEAPT